MSNYLTVTVPVIGKDNKTRYRRVGVAFYNRQGAKAEMSLKLDFPVGATEFVLFAPRDNEGDDDHPE